MGFGCFGLFEKQGKKGGNASDAKIDYPRVEKPQKDPQERIDQSVEDITLQTALNDLENQKEQPVSKDSGIGELDQRIHFTTKQPQPGILTRPSSTSVRHFRQYHCPSSRFVHEADRASARAS